MSKRFNRFKVNFEIKKFSVMMHHLNKNFHSKKSDQASLIVPSLCFSEENWHTASFSWGDRINIVWLLLWLCDIEDIIWCWRWLCQNRRTIQKYYQNNDRPISASTHAIGSDYISYVPQITRAHSQKVIASVTSVVFFSHLMA